MNDRTPELEAVLEREAATREILEVINRSPDDYQPVFDAVLEQATRLCEAPLGLLLIREADGFHAVSQRGPHPDCAEYFRNHPVPDDPEWSVTARCAAECRPIQVLDVANDPIYRAGQEHRRLAVEVDGVRSQLTVPLVRDGNGIGVILVYRREVRSFDDDQVTLLSDFAELAVIALENVRRFRALNASLEHQTATGEILRVINRSRDDYQPVFDTILEHATRLCRARFGVLFLVRDEHLHPVAFKGVSPDFVEYREANPVPIGDGSSPVLGGAVRDRVPKQVLDFEEDSRQSGVERRIGAAKLGGIKTLLGVPILKDDEVVGVIGMYRKHVEAFSDRDVELVSTFADQAVIAIENVRSFQAVQTRTAELAQSLERQTATSEILRAISRSPTDNQPVFDTILGNATRLCDAPLAQLYLIRDGGIHLVASRGTRDEFLTFVRDNVRPADRTVGGIGRALSERRPVHAHDIAGEDLYRRGDKWRVAAVELEGIRTLVTVPMLKGDEPIGVIVLYRREVRPFDSEDVSLVETFADQAVIAIENVRSFQAVEARTAELSKSLERQTATSEILRVISRSPTDYAPVFDTILGRASHLCHAQFAFLFLLRDGHLHVVASVGGTPEFQDFFRDTPIPLEHPGSITARAARERCVVNVPDVTETPAYQVKDNVRLAAAIDVGSIRSFLCVPMYKGDTTVGVLCLFRHEVGAFADEDVQLVSTFADQAVIAIENVRSFQAVEARTAELTQSLERQTATSEILRSISRSPTDYNPVFDSILRNATRLCGAPFGTLFLLRDDHLHMVANSGAEPEFVEFMRANPVPLALANPGPVVLAANERKPVQFDNLDDDTVHQENPFRSLSTKLGNVRTLLGVPLLKGGETVGVVALHRQVVRPFTDEEIQLVSTFADQAVIAIENVRLFRALEERNTALNESLERQTATSEILRAISRSPTDYAPVFQTILNNAIRLCGAPFGHLLLFRDGHFHLVADAGPHAAMADFLRANPYSLDDPLALVSRAARARKPLQVEDLSSVEYHAEDPVRSTAVRLGSLCTAFCVPILKGEEVVGVISLYRQEVRPFDDADIELVSTFADQAVIAIENVRLFQAVESRSAALAQSVAELEALADVAQAVSSSLDVETVLNTIVERAVELSGAHAGAINVLDEDSGTLVPRAAPGVEELLELPAPRLGEGAVGRAAATRAPVQIPDIAVPGAYTGGLLDALAHLRIRALLAVPMIQDDRVRGTLVVARRTPGDFPPETVRVLQALGTQSAIAMRNARLYREIEDQSRELEAANRHKSEFLANMSHELRTPLNAVIGFSEVLGERMFGALNEKQAEYINDIHESGRHLLSLINDILDLSKIEAGAMELDVGRFAVAPALDNALTLVKERAGRRGVSLESQLEVELGEMEGDERKLKQILLNLLSNAIKFTDAGGRVVLEARRDDQTVAIAVSDTGVGISDEDQGVIFDEFRQVGTDYARKVEGTGLGLTLTRRFVEMHGGTLAVESTPGEGSTFRVTLPVRAPEVTP